MDELTPVSLTKATAKDRFEYLLENIRERIIRLEYPPGTRIGETELAAEFGVSRTPIRRVLSRLEYEEFVEIRQGSGNYITEIDWDELKDAYEFRMRLAELIGDLAPKILSQATIDAVRQIREKVKERGNHLSVLEYREFNSALQNEIDKCIGNRQLRKTINRLYYLTQRHWHAWLPQMDWGAEIEAFHWQLDDTIRCLENSDSRGVGLVWRNVISSMITRLEKAYSQSITKENPMPTQNNN